MTFLEKVTPIGAMNLLKSLFPKFHLLNVSGDGMAAWNRCGDFGIAELPMATPQGKALVV